MDKMKSLVKKHAISYNKCIRNNLKQRFVELLSARRPSCETVISLLLFKNADGNCFSSAFVFYRKRLAMTLCKAVAMVV